MNYAPAFLKGIKMLPISDLRKHVRSSTVRETIIRAARKRIKTEEERRR